MRFATTPEEIAEHGALVQLVDDLRASHRLAERSLSVLVFWRADDLASRLLTEIDGGFVWLSHEEGDEIAALAGQYFYGADLPEEPDWDDPTIAYEMAKWRLETGEGIWTDERLEDKVAEYRARGIEALIYRGPIGPITLEEHDELDRRWAEQQRAKILGLMNRTVQ